MIYQITSQDVTFRDYPIQFPPIGSSIIGTDINEALDSSLSIFIRQKRLTESFYSLNLLSLLEIDLSSVYPHFGIKSETSSIKREVLPHISKLVDKVIKDSEFFKKVDKTKLIEFFSYLIEGLQPGQLISITEDELTRRIEKIVLIEAMTGVLNELSPTQTESFEAAIKRREFFK